MATEMRRFTVSVAPDMDLELDGAKKENYYKNTQNEMIRDLIARGLQDLKTEKAAKEKGGYTQRTHPTNSMGMGK